MAVDYLDGNIVNLHLIQSHKSIDVIIQDDAGALAEHEQIVDDDWLAFSALEVESCKTT